MIGFNSLFQPTSAKSSRMQFRLYLALLSDCNITNWPSTTGGKMDNSPLLAGKSWYAVDAIATSIDPTVEKDDEERIEGRLKIEPVLEGISKDSLSWIYANNGARVVAVWTRCADGQKFIAGSPCSGGLRLTYTKIGKMDGNNSGIKLLLHGGECAEPEHEANFSMTTNYTFKVIDEYYKNDGTTLESSDIRVDTTKAYGSTYNYSALSPSGYDVSSQQSYSGTVTGNTTITFKYKKQLVSYTLKVIDKYLAEDGSVDHEDVRVNTTKTEGSAYSYQALSSEGYTVEPSNASGTVSQNTTVTFVYTPLADVYDINMPGLSSWEKECISLTGTKYGGKSGDYSYSSIKTGSEDYLLPDGSFAFPLVFNTCEDSELHSPGTYDVEFTKISTQTVKIFDNTKNLIHTMNAGETLRLRGTFTLGVMKRYGYLALYTDVSLYDMGGVFTVKKNN